MEQHYETKNMAVTSDFEMDKKEKKVIDSFVIQVQRIQRQI